MRKIFIAKEEWRGGRRRNEENIMRMAIINQSYYGEKVFIQGALWFETWLDSC